MGIVKSDLENMNFLVDGYDPEVPMAIFAIAKSGKTMLCIQEAFYLMGKIKKNALFFSTEVGVKRYIEKLEPIFRKRFDIPDSLKMILVECPPQAAHLEKVAKYFGKKIKLEMGKTGRVDVQFLGSEDSDIERIVVKENVGILVIDSLTKPFKSEEFAGVLKNLPPRASAVNIWLNAVHALTVKHKLITFVTHHASMDPTNPYATPSMTGGGDINYDFKIQLYMEQSKSNRPFYSNLRWLHLVRFFNIKEWSKKTRLYVDDLGYRDVDDIFMQKIQEMADKVRKEKVEAAKAYKSGAKGTVEKADEKEDEDSE